MVKTGTGGPTMAAMLTAMWRRGPRKSRSNHEATGLAVLACEESGTEKRDNTKSGYKK
jgi:hypothetical protein